jgi:hypothetical protein
MTAAYGGLVFHHHVTHFARPRMKRLAKDPSYCRAITFQESECNHQVVGKSIRFRDKVGRATYKCDDATIVQQRRSVFHLPNLFTCMGCSADCLMKFGTRQLNQRLTKQACVLMTSSKMKDIIRQYAVRFTVGPHYCKQAATASGYRCWYQAGGV